MHLLAPVLFRSCGVPLVQGPMRVVFPLLVVMGTLVCGPAAANGPGPTTWTELQPHLEGKKPEKRLQALLRFSRDEDVPLSDRRRAAGAASALSGISADDRLDAILLQAHLCAVSGDAPGRARALVDARGAAKKISRESRRQRLDEMREGEAAMAELSALLARRTPGKPAAPDEKKLAARVEATVSSWISLGDERQAAAARLLLAKRGQLDGEGEQAARALRDLVDALGKRRDGAALREEASRLLAVHHEQRREWKEALSHSLAADRAAFADPRRTLPAPVPPYLRTAHTAALCKRARAASTSCARLERSAGGEPTFYDFSQDLVAPGGGLDPNRADDVLAEYESLLQNCMQAGARANLTASTHVELEWSVGNDGHTLTDFDLRPKRLRKTSVETCIAKALAVFRYPSYSGEMQHVRLTYDVGEVQE